jgi:hypothetical protein
VASALSRAIYEEANEVFRESQLQVPYRTGALAGSGMVNLPTIDSSGNILVEIFYGGAAAPYALYVHEERDRNYRNGRKAKYLYDPMMRRVGIMGKNIMDRVDHMLKVA